MATDRYYFETRGTARRRPTTLSAEANGNSRHDLAITRLLNDLDSEIGMLTESIAHEERMTLVTDPDSLKYSLAAKSMRSRRDNLLKTKSALLDRLNPAFSPMAAGGCEAPAPDAAMHA